ncbi:hypothetical protein BKA61DRAFT_619813 [Leptodontidium sp. MPI-SDFR-AT-0119]|nr:hypothetical protein BKA61DRAFT_619813 [Leptodontidium sp. MPI-SDFR-AT-0119]
MYLYYHCHSYRCWLCLLLPVQQQQLSLAHSSLASKPSGALGFPIPPSGPPLSSRNINKLRIQQRTNFWSLLSRPIPTLRSGKLFFPPIFHRQPK